MNNYIKAKSKAFLKEYKLNKITLHDLKQVVVSQGYIIVEFNHVINDDDVATLIDALGLDDLIRKSKGFTYADRQRRLVFLHEDLSDNEKLLVLAHEEGHIYCGHIASVPVIGRDVIEEHEANEFAHYILKPSSFRKAASFVKTHKKILSVIAVILVVSLLSLLIVATVNKERSYFGEYYLTSTGNKYHEEECIFVKDKTNVRRMTVEEFETGDYEPCGICLPPSNNDKTGN